MIAAPRWEITQRLIGPITPILLLSLVHFLVVLLAAAAPGGLEPILIFADVFDPTKNQLDGMVKLFEFRDFVAEEWPHVLIWDLFAGRCIWLDALTRGVPKSLLAPSLLASAGGRDPSERWRPPGERVRAGRLRERTRRFRRRSRNAAGLERSTCAACPGSFRSSWTSIGKTTSTSSSWRSSGSRRTWWAP